MLIIHRPGASEKRLAKLSGYAAAEASAGPSTYGGFLAASWRAEARLAIGED
jgi:hypothetical protein